MAALLSEMLTKLESKSWTEIRMMMLAVCCSADFLLALTLSSLSLPFQSLVADSNFVAKEDGQHIKVVMMMVSFYPFCGQSVEVQARAPISAQLVLTLLPREKATLQQ